MNYGKQTVNRKKKNISSKKTMKKKRVGVRLFKALIICILLIAVVGVACVGLFAKRIIDNTPTVTPADVKPSGFTSFVYSEDGTLLESFLESGSNRVYRSIDEIPQDLADAFVAIEDSRFYDHNGIDLKGILRAGIKGIASGGDFSEGASTITQQLIKNNVFPNFLFEETFYDRLERKLQEQVLALQIEKQMSKEEILESYMNTINLGQNCLGVQSAAKRYFGKDVSELTLSESAVIAGITQNPTGYDPVVYPEANAERREKVLGDMLDQGYISQTEYDEAMADNVYERIIQTAAGEDTNPYSYFNDELIEQIINDLQEKKGYFETQAYNALYSGGLTIISTQDPTIQKICDEEVANESVYPYGTEYGLEYALTITRADGTVENHSKEMLASYLSSKNGSQYPLVFSSTDAANEAIADYKATLNITEADTVDERIDITPQPQTSVVIMEQSTGKVKAIVGGRGEKTSSLSLNRATDSTRQPGSCFKIVSTYAPAIDSCGYTLATSIPDEGPFQYPGTNQTANNWDGIYLGQARVRYAIEHSMNVCALNTLQDITPQTGYDYLLNFGFTTLVNFDDENYPNYTDVQLATALGGITRGVYNLEMTAAYAAIANEGTYIEPILYTQVLDHDGNVLLDNSTPDSHQVIKDTTAALLTSAMQDVINRGTGTAARLSNMPAAGKTGTTEHSTDLWLSAYTPYYTCSVWGGYDQNKPMESMSQVWHEVLWKNIMERVHENLEYKDFTMPSSIQQRTVCNTTGMLASTEFCSAVTEYFAEGTYTGQSCNGHQAEIAAQEEERLKEEEEKKKAEEEAKAEEGATGGETTTTPPADTGTTTTPPADTSGGSTGDTTGTAPAQ
ncbi:MAG: transglycosylase domain-containing protein [Ruminococcus sp.]|nr:transglycosylase domain-containing protein [Ruminococcus sp.]